MALSKTPYRGTRDFFPPQMRIREYIFAKMKKTAELFGFEPYDGPLLEEVDLYRAKSGEELINEQIYSFTDRGNRFVAIRPEMTPTLARMVSQVHKELPKPLRWYAIPNLMRYEKPQKGRLREHWQFNCDIFGATGRMGELEILQLAVTLLEGFGANSNHFEILFNDRSFIDTVFKDVLALSQEESYRLYKIVDKSKKVTKEALKEMLVPILPDEKRQTIFERYLSLGNINEAISFLNEFQKTEMAQELTKLGETLSTLSEYLRFDPCIVRGLDYYTGVVFEIFDKNPENRRAICGGGAYANLITIFDSSALPGVGFGLGDVTLTDFLQTHKLLPEGVEKPCVDLLASFQTEKALGPSTILSQALRKKGIRVEQSFEELKIKKLFPLAEKKGARFAALIGDDELAKGVVQIKDLSAKEQKEFSLTDIDGIFSFINK